MYPEELIGKELGQYRIEAKIGEGGMAAVFKAYQPSLNRYVAIKVPTDQQLKGAWQAKKCLRLCQRRFE
jgi:hypothetical protein